MATSVNWITGVITVQRADMALIQTLPTEIRQLDLNSFHLELRDLEDDVDGRPWTRTHTHNTTVVVGGVSLARVIEILEPYTITFEDGQYAVNLVGANSNVGDRINVNQVSVRSANSAGLVDLEILISSAYQGHVVVNHANGQSGTDEPIGTFQAPSNNMADALAIAEKQGIRKFTFLDGVTLLEDYSAGYEFVGISPFVVLTADTTANIIGCSISSMTVQGVFDGFSVVRNCSINNITDASGFFENCSFTGTVALNGKLDAYDCYSQVEGGGYPVFDVGSNAFVTRNMRGSIGIVNADVGHLSSIGLSEGRFIADSSNIGGEIHVRGEPFEILDTSGVSCDVIYETEGHKINSIHGQVSRSIYIDTELVDNGNGYQQTPYNNWSDAVDYAEANGIKNLVLLADATIDRQLKNFVITGVGTPIIDCNGQNLDKSEISRCTLTGEYTGELIAQESSLTGTFTLNGFFENCALGSDFKIPDGGSALIKDCSSFVVGLDIPVFDVGGVAGTGALIITGWNGAFKVINVNQPTDDVKLVVGVGRVILDSTCTDGKINVVGVARLVNDSAGSVIVNEVIDPDSFQNMHTRLGLEEGNAWTDTPTQSGDASGNIIIQNTGDGETTSTGTRQ